MSNGSQIDIGKTLAMLWKGGLIRTFLISILALVVFVFVWWGAAILLKNAYLPTPDLVFTALIQSFQRADPTVGTSMWQNIFASMQRFLLGFALAFVVAVPLGLVMGFSHWADDFAKPIVEVFRPIPPIAWIAFLLVVTGTFLTPIITVFIGVFFPLLSNVKFGVESVEPALLDAARTQGAGKLTLFSKVIMPYSIPFLMTGVRIGMGIGWMCIVAAEILSAVGGGVGYYINAMGGIGKFPEMFAGMIVIAILGIATTGLAGYAEKITGKRMGMKS